MVVCGGGCQEVVVAAVGYSGGVGPGAFLRLR